MLDILLKKLYSKLINNLWREKERKSRQRGGSEMPVILIIIIFGELFLRISPRTINGLGSSVTNTWKTVWSNFQKPRIWFEKRNSAASRFFNPLLSVWKLDKALFLVFDILILCYANIFEWSRCWGGGGWIQEIQRLGTGDCSVIGGTTVEVSGQGPSRKLKKFRFSDIHFLHWKLT